MGRDSNGPPQRPAPGLFPSGSGGGGNPDLPQGCAAPLPARGQASVSVSSPSLVSFRASKGAPLRLGGPSTTALFGPVTASHLLSRGPASPRSWSPSPPSAQPRCRSARKAAVSPRCAVRDPPGRAPLQRFDLSGSWILPISQGIYAPSVPLRDFAGVKVFLPRFQDLLFSGFWAGVGALTLGDHLG